MSAQVNQLTLVIPNRSSLHNLIVRILLKLLLFEPNIQSHLLTSDASVAVWVSDMRTDLVIWYGAESRLSSDLRGFFEQNVVMNKSFVKWSDVQTINHKHNGSLIVSEQFFEWFKVLEYLSVLHLKSISCKTCKSMSVYSRYISKSSCLECSCVMYRHYNEINKYKYQKRLTNNYLWVDFFIV